jgi:hypothetical protein
VTLRDAYEHTRYIRHRLADNLVSRRTGEVVSCDNCTVVCDIREDGAPPERLGEAYGSPP